MGTDVVQQRIRPSRQLLPGVSCHVVVAAVDVDIATGQWLVLIAAGLSPVLTKVVWPPVVVYYCDKNILKRLLRLGLRWGLSLLLLLLQWWWCCERQLVDICLTWWQRHDRFSHQFLTGFLPGAVGVAHGVLLGGFAVLHQQLTQAALGVYLGVVIKPLKACPQPVASSSVLVMHTPTNQQTVVSIALTAC